MSSNINITNDKNKVQKLKAINSSYFRLREAFIETKEEGTAPQNVYL